MHVITGHMEKEGDRRRLEIEHRPGSKKYKLTAYGKGEVKPVSFIALPKARLRELLLHFANDGWNVEVEI